MKTILATVLTLALSAPGALADNAVPLAPGKPAGLHQAQFEDSNGMLIVAAAALVGIGVALSVAGNGSAPIATTPTTSSTSTTGTAP
jgi:hypothetical protein